MFGDSFLQIIIIVYNKQKFLIILFKSLEANDNSYRTYYLYSYLVKLKNMFESNSVNK